MTPTGRPPGRGTSGGQQQEGKVEPGGVALEADNAHGAEHDVVSQLYGISRADLVLELATSALDGRPAVPTSVHDAFPHCDAAFALGRICNTSLDPGHPV